MNPRLGYSYHQHEVIRQFGKPDQHSANDFGQCPSPLQRNTCPLDLV